MRTFKSLILLLMVTVAPTIYAAAAAEYSRTEGVLSRIAASFLGGDINAANARTHFHRLSDHSVALFGIGKDLHDLTCVTAANKAAVADYKDGSVEIFNRDMKQLPFPLSKDSLPLAISHREYKLHTAYRSDPNQSELNVTVLIAQSIDRYPDAHIETILRTTREVSLSPAAVNLWLLLWTAHNDRTYDPLIIRDAAGDRDYLTTLREEVIPVMRAYQDWIASAAPRAVS